MPEVRMEPYTHFLSALLDQASKDAGSPKLERRRAAWRWLRADPDCVDICAWLDLDHRALLTAIEQREATEQKGHDVGIANLAFTSSVYH